MPATRAVQTPRPNRGFVENMIGVIVNPNSKKNKKRKGHIPRLQSILGDDGIVIQTEDAQHLENALDAFRERGVKYWLADGGDGALHWMLNTAAKRYGEDEAFADTVFVPTNGGTVDFVAKAIQLKGKSPQICRRILDHEKRGKGVRVELVSTVRVRGTRRLDNGTVEEFQRFTFANAFAGYGANFYGPYYRGGKEGSPLRIAGLIALGLTAGVSTYAFPGPLKALRPGFVERAQHDFLRPLHANVRVDGEPVRDADGNVVTQHNAIHTASVKVNLGGVLRVFPLAEPGTLHIHAGGITPAEMVKIMPTLVTGGIVDGMLPNAYDGPCKRLEIQCINDEMAAILDGEVYPGVLSLDVTPGPAVKMPRS